MVEVDFGILAQGEAQAAAAKGFAHRMAATIPNMHLRLACCSRNQTRRRDPSEASQLEGPRNRLFVLGSCSRPEDFTSDWRPEANRTGATWRADAAISSRQ